MNTLFIFLQNLNIQTQPKISEPKHKISEPDLKCRNPNGFYTFILENPKILNTRYESERVSERAPLRYMIICIFLEEKKVKPLIIKFSL